ncbi:MAG: mechanosensitive ion channel family protein [Elainellaceae cyanobacterium]
MEPLNNFLQQEFLRNTVETYLITLGILLLGFIIAPIVWATVARSLKQWATQTTTDLDDALLRILRRSLVPVIYLATFYIALNNLNLLDSIDRIVDSISIVIATVLGIRLVISLAEYAIRLYWITHHHSSEGLNQSLNALLPAVRAIVWGLGIVFLLDNLGFDISAVIAGLGIGGVAVALASQGILKDLFSYFSILFDRPFELGDFIIVGDYMGAVERVGIKTTRLRSLGGEELVMPNTDLTGSRIRNYKRMQRRRIVFHIGVTYETGLTKLESISDLIQEIIVNADNAIFDRAHFLEYGDFSLNFEVVYFVTSNDYNLYMDTQQTINLALKRRFQERGIDFAYPTQVQYLASLNGDSFSLEQNGQFHEGRPEMAGVKSRD